MGRPSIASSARSGCSPRSTTRTSSATSPTAVDAAGTACLVVEWLEGEDLAPAASGDSGSSPAEALEVVRQAAAASTPCTRRGSSTGTSSRPTSSSSRRATARPGQGHRPGHRPRRGGGDADRRSASRWGRRSTCRPSRPAARSASPRAPTCSRSGCVLFELLSGRRPYTGDDFFAVLAKIVLQDPPRLARRAARRAAARWTRWCAGR